MEADMLKTQFLVTKLKLRLPVSPEREGRVAAANRMLPKMYKGFPYLRKIACEIGHSFSLILFLVWRRILSLILRIREARRYGAARPDCTSSHALSSRTIRAEDSAAQRRLLASYYL